MSAYITQEELLKPKKKVDFLSAKAKESYELLMNLCNEISFAENLSSFEKSSSEADDIIYLLSRRIIDHLTCIHSLISAYEEYSKTLEKLIPQAETGRK